MSTVNARVNFSPEDLAIPSLFLETVLSDDDLKQKKGPFTCNKGHGLILTFITEPREGDKVEKFRVIQPKSGQALEIEGVEIRKSKDLGERKVIALHTKERSWKTLGDNEFPLKAEMIDRCLNANRDWVYRLRDISGAALRGVCEDLNQRIADSSKMRGKQLKLITVPQEAAASPYGN